MADEGDVGDDLAIAVAFEHAVIYDGDIAKAMQYAHPDFEVREAPTTPYRSPIVGAAGLAQLREDVTRLCETWGDAETEYFLARPGLVVGRIRRNARLRATGEPFDFRVTEWLTVEDGLVKSVEVYYFENAPLARAAALMDVERAT
jgi:ketosteroid isomerase-like protein